MCQSPSPRNESMRYFFIVNRYHTLLEDCRQCYLTQRSVLLMPCVIATVEEIKKLYSTDHCGLVGITIISTIYIVACKFGMHSPVKMRCEKFNHYDINMSWSESIHLYIYPFTMLLWMPNKDYFYHFSCVQDVTFCVESAKMSFNFSFIFSMKKHKNWSKNHKILMIASALFKILDLNIADDEVFSKFCKPPGNVWTWSHFSLLSETFIITHFPCCSFTYNSLKMN